MRAVKNSKNQLEVKCNAEMQLAARESKAAPYRLECPPQVFKCSSGKTDHMTNLEFKQEFVKDDGDMLKVKDWPQEQHFRDLLKRHNQDFAEMLPAPFLARLDHAPLNNATHQASFANKTDLGPKVYVAQGQVR